jgi:hypothetical protein
MIVKCSNCDSAFTVSDDKVSGKKFAFTCPNCSFNNIIDNRENGSGLSYNSQDSDYNPDVDENSNIPDSFEFPDENEPSFSDSTFEDEFAPVEEEFPATASKSIAEAMNDSTIIDETPADMLDDSTFDFDNLDSEAFTSENPTQRITGISDAEMEDTSDEIDLSTLDDMEIEENVVIDTSNPDSINEPAVDLNSFNMTSDADDEDDNSLNLDPFNSDINEDMSELMMESESAETESVSNFENTTEDDDLSIDLDDLEAEFDNDNNQGSVEDISFDLDSLDMEDSPTSVSTSSTIQKDDESISIDLDSLDADLDMEDSTGLKTTGSSDDLEDESISIDLDSLDADIDMEDSPELKTTGSSDDLEDESISIDLDSLDADLDMEDSTGLKTTGSSDDLEDESISIDLDSLDADLDMEDTPGLNTADSSDDLEDESISIDIDSLDADLDMEDSPELKTAGSSDDLEDESISIDLDSLDADLDMEDSSELKTAGSSDDLEDESISIDLDSLDADLYMEDSPGLNAAGSSDDLEDESISIDLDSLDADLDMEDSPGLNAAESRDDLEDESISIDLDSLDADLDMEDSPGLKTAASSDDLEDESISIDLDSLDAQLDEEISAIDSSDTLDDYEDESISIDLGTFDTKSDSDDSIVTSQKNRSEMDIDILGIDDDDLPEIDMSTSVETEQKNSLHETFDDDEITVDLDSLEMELEESNDYNEPDIETHALSDDEIRETLSIDIDDEFIGDDLPLGEDPLGDDLLAEQTPLMHEDQYDDLYSETGTTAYSDSTIESSLYDDDLPEIDLDKYDELDLENVSPGVDSDILMDLSDTDTVDVNKDEINSVLGGGYVHFTIDYSLKYSRVLSLLRILGLYYITFIPHLIVNILYSMVNSIIAYISNIMVLLSGKLIPDFVKFQEKSLRYWISSAASLSNIIEEKPPYPGAHTLDYQLQLDVHPPIHRSRFIAGLRVSIIGIIFITIPHILIFTILTFATQLFILIGLFSVLFTTKWPGFIFDYMVRYYRYFINISAFMTGLIDSYPSFRFE